ncbi:DUF6891 domain-containing protein [Streptomyces avermitilis]|uniref:DUF6891 domain-containing protein n=1 Tax=Streptomyces avermitilis TaxID=33903 RepID=UPI003F5358DD
MGSARGRPPSRWAPPRVVSGACHGGGTSKARARRSVDRLWLERPAERETWQGVTGPERLALAFAALGASGLTGRR